MYSIKGYTVSAVVAAGTTAAGVAGGFLAAKSKFVRGFKDRQVAAVDALTKVTREVEAEQLALARIRAERFNEVQRELITVKAQMSALQQLYQSAVEALHLSSMRESQLKLQVEEQTRIFTRLQSRVSEVELSDARNASGTGDSGGRAGKERSDSGG